MLSTIFDNVRPEKLQHDQREQKRLSAIERHCQELLIDLNHYPERQQRIEAAIERLEAELRKAGGL